MLIHSSTEWTQKDFTFAYTPMVRRRLSQPSQHSQWGLLRHNQWWFSMNRSPSFAYWKECKTTKSLILEPPHDKTSKVSVRPAKTRNPPSLIRVFAVRMKEPWFLSYPLSAQRRLWSDWADAQADLSLPWVHTILLVLSWGGSFLVSVKDCIKLQE